MGATFCSNPENPRSPVAYCSRPGLRLWIANKEGIVEKTLMFKVSSNFWKEFDYVVHLTFDT